MISLAVSKGKDTRDLGTDNKVFQAEAAPHDQVNLFWVERACKVCTPTSFPAEQCFQETEEEDVAIGSCTRHTAALLSSLGVDIHVPNALCPGIPAAGGFPTDAVDGAAAEQLGDRHVSPWVQTQDDVETAQTQSPAREATSCKPRNLQSKLPPKTQESLPSPIAEEGCHGFTNHQTADRPPGLNGLGDCQTSRMMPQEHQELGNSRTSEGFDSHYDQSAELSCFTASCSNPFVNAGSVPQDRGACNSQLLTNQTFAEPPSGGNQDNLTKFSSFSQEVMCVSTAKKGQPDLVVRRSVNQQVWAEGDLPVEPYLRQLSQGFSPTGGNGPGPAFPLGDGSPFSNPNSPAEQHQGK